MKPRFTDLFEFVPILNEVFDTRIPVNDWKFKEKDLVGSLNIDDQTFTIHIHPTKHTIKGKLLQGANLAFYALINGKEVEEMTFNNQVGSKILGAISNALVDKVDEFELDYILLVAKNESDKRIRIYRQIASFNVKALGFKMLEPIKTKNDESVIILVKKNLDQSLVDYIENNLSLEL